VTHFPSLHDALPIFKRIEDLRELARKKLASISDAGPPAGQRRWPAPRPPAIGLRLRLAPVVTDADVDDQRDCERVGVLHPLAGRSEEHTSELQSREN